MIRTNAAEQAARMRRNADQAVAAAAAVSSDYGRRLQAGVRQRISGSGLHLSAGSGLLESVQVHDFTGRTMVGSKVGSARPESHRLDAGFVGTDALGRHVDAPPFRAYEPALNALADAYRRDVVAAISQALQR